MIWHTRAILVLMTLSGILNAAPATLQLIVETSRSTISEADRIEIYCYLKNTGVSDVEIPAVTNENEGLYFTIAIRDSKGRRVNDITFSDPWAFEKARGWMTIPPSSYALIAHYVNLSRAGFVAFPDISKKYVVERTAGVMTVSATFEVNSSNVPDVPSATMFSGRIDSTVPATFEVIAKDSGDLNADGKVDCADVAIVRSGMGTLVGGGGYDIRADVNNDGRVDVRDLAIVAQKFVSSAQCR